MSPADWSSTPPLLKKWLAVLAAATAGRDADAEEPTTDGSLTLGDVCVLMWILDYASAPAWRAWPSVATLVRVTGMSRSTVIRAINNLEATGHLRIERGDHSTSNRYWPTFKGAAEVMTRKAVAGRFAAGSDAGGATDDATPNGGVTDDTSWAGVTDDTSCGSTDGTGVVSPTDRSGAAGRANLVSSVKPDSNHYTDASSVGVGGGAVDASIASRPVGAVAPGGAPPSVAGTEAFARFKEVFAGRLDDPRAVQAKLEQVLNSGQVSIDELIAEARAYRELKRLQNFEVKHTKSAIRWLATSEWEAGYVDQLERFRAEHAARRPSKKESLQVVGSPQPGTRPSGVEARVRARADPAPLFRSTSEDVGRAREHLREVMACIKEYENDDRFNAPLEGYEHDPSEFVEVENYVTRLHETAIAHGLLPIERLIQVLEDRLKATFDPAHLVDWNAAKAFKGHFSPERNHWGGDVVAAAIERELDALVVAQIGCQPTALASKRDVSSATSSTCTKSPPRTHVQQWRFRASPEDVAQAEVRRLASMAYIEKTEADDRSEAQLNGRTVHPTRLVARKDFSNLLYDKAIKHGLLPIERLFAVIDDRLGRGSWTARDAFDAFVFPEDEDGGAYVADVEAVISKLAEEMRSEAAA